MCTFAVFLFGSSTSLLYMFVGLTLLIFLYSYTGLLALPSEFPHSVSNLQCAEFGLGMRMLNADAGIVSAEDIGSSTETIGYHRSSRSNFQMFPD